MPFELPSLPYAMNALEPYISQKTLEFHYGKHHQAYVTNLNNLIRDTPFATKDMEEIIIETSKMQDKAAIFNNAAQAWNHTFYWQCMTPNGGGSIPEGAFKNAVITTFGSEEKFKEDLKNAAVSQFGSGWAWLVKENGALKIVKTGNADTPIAHHQIPLLTIDVWEHAYYLDYQNRRPDYAQTLIDHLINWNFVISQFDYAGE